MAVSGLSGYLYPAGLDEGIVRDGSFHSESIGFWVGRITFDDGRADVETVAGLLWLINQSLHPLVAFLCPEHPVVKA